MVNATLNNKGFTLLEAMIAISLLTFIMLWTLQGMLSAYNFAARNQHRNEGVRVAGEVLTEARNIPYATLSKQTQPSNEVRARQIRNYSAAYTVKKTVTPIGTDGLACSVNIVVSWIHKGIPYNYTVSTIVADK